MKNQCQLVLNHLIDHGYITDLVARNYGVRRLASRIHDLKTIGGVGVQVQTRRDDQGNRYAYYFLSEDARAVEREIRDEGGTWNGRPAMKAAA